MNNKGFMMAELVVVASIIIITLTTFFTSYTKLIINYNRLVNYYDVGATYRLGYYYKNKLNYINNEISQGNISINKYIQIPIGNTENENIEEIPNNSAHTVTYKDNLYLLKTNNINENTITGINETFKEYINFFNNSLKNDVNTSYVLILESCQTKNSIEKCKYAYMEVPNE